MAKLTLIDVTNPENEQSFVNTLNSNFTTIENAVENTLSRDGTTPNTMLADLDMNSHHVVNLPLATVSTEPIRKDQFDAAVFSVISATSTTSNSVGTGSKTFTIAAGKAFPVGSFVLIVRTSAPSNYMGGSVTSYSGTTLVVNVTASSASAGPFTDWSIYTSGPAGATGSTGANGEVLHTGAIVSGHNVKFNDATGTVIADGGVVAADIVTGPASATDKAVAIYNGTGGKTLQNSAVVITTGAVTGVTTLATSGDITTSAGNINATAGKVKENSVNISSIGKQTLPILAGSMSPKVTSPAGAANYDSGSNDITIRVLDFDQTNAEFAHFHWLPPKSWNNGTVTFQPYWTADAGTATQTVIFTLAGVAISDDDVMNASFGTAQSSTKALSAVGDLMIGPESSAITIAGTPATADLVCFQLARDIADTLAADARLIGIKFYFTTNASNDV